MTPAEELRAAAAKVREYAKGTTEGPWHHHDTHLHHGGHTATVFARPGGGEWAFSLVAWLPSSSHEPWSDHPCWMNSRWIALAHPGLAEHLAPLLDLFAAMYEVGLVDAAGSIAALNLARDINGGAS